MNLESIKSGCMADSRGGKEFKRDGSDNKTFSSEAVW